MPGALSTHPPTHPPTQPRLGNSHSSQGTIPGQVWGHNSLQAWSKVHLSRTPKLRLNLPLSGPQASGKPSPKYQNWAVNTKIRIPFSHVHTRIPQPCTVPIVPKSPMVWPRPRFPAGFRLWGQDQKSWAPLSPHPGEIKAEHLEKTQVFPNQSPKPSGLLPIAETAGGMQGPEWPWAWLVPQRPVS